MSDTKTVVHTEKWNARPSSIDDRNTTQVTSAQIY